MKDEGIEGMGEHIVKRLWNRNFTILTIGSFISALGSSASGVAFGILIYQKTGSPLALALFTIANILPRMITAFLAGPYIDRHSRVKIIYSLDFLSTVSYAVVAIVLFYGYFDVFVFTILASIFGIIDTIYQIAFMSLFPETIPEGQFAKAYSLSSLIWPISAAVMFPIAAWMIDQFAFGVALLMAFNAGTYFVAALFETTMNIKETLNVKPVVRFQFLEDMREGFRYYKFEKGILGIGLLFAAFAFVNASHDLLLMPYFLSSDTLTIQNFSFLITASSIGRILGGILHYTFTYPPKRRFQIAVTVYFTIEIMGATFLFMPYFLMIVVNFLMGLLAVTSYNIRMSATQSYLPPAMRGRINSTQGFLANLGTILGCLIIGIVAQYSGLSYRTIILLSAVVTFSAILLIPLRMNREFKKIYNAEVKG